MPQSMPVLPFPSAGWWRSRFHPSAARRFTKSITMKLLLLSCFFAAAAVIAADPQQPQPPKPSDKPQSFQHTSSLQKDPTNQHIDAASTEAAAAEEYRQLTSDEVKQLLLKVVDENIDKNKDGFIVADELKDWLRVLQEKVIQDNVNRQWAYYHPQTEEVLSWEGYYPEQKQVVSWERYLNYTYPDEALKADDSQMTPEIKEVKEMIRRAERRWKNADTDEDGSLSKGEFRDFIHPEESQRAGGVAVIEAMEDMDSDKNGEVSLEEYMAHLNKVSGEEKEDPNWASAQEGHFSNFLDTNKDGSLNETEMREWVVPTYDRSEAEAWRLVSIADQDQDHRLSRKDIEDYHEYFLTLLPPEYWVQEDPADSSKHDEF